MEEGLRRLLGRYAEGDRRFSGTDFDGWSWVPRRADLRGADLSGAKFDQIEWTDVNLNGANLRGCDFSYCSFLGGDLSGCDFSDSTFHQSHISSTIAHGGLKQSGQQWHGMLQTEGPIVDRLTRVARSGGAHGGGPGVVVPRLEDASFKWARVYSSRISGVMKNTDLRFMGTDDGGITDRFLSEAPLAGAILTRGYAARLMADFSADIRGAEIGD